MEHEPSCYNLLKRRKKKLIHLSIFCSLLLTGIICAAVGNSISNASASQLGGIIILVSTLYGVVMVICLYLDPHAFRCIDDNWDDQYMDID